MMTCTNFSDFTKSLREGRVRARDFFEGGGGAGLSCPVPCNKMLPEWLLSAQNTDARRNYLQTLGAHTHTHTLVVQPRAGFQLMLRQHRVCAEPDVGRETAMLTSSKIGLAAALRHNPAMPTHNPHNHQTAPLSHYNHLKMMFTSVWDHNNSGPKRPSKRAVKITVRRGAGTRQCSLGGARIWREYNEGVLAPVLAMVAFIGDAVVAFMTPR